MQSLRRASGFQGPPDTGEVARWKAYSRRRDIERRETINLANRIYGAPAAHWSKCGKT